MKIAVVGSREFFLIPDDKNLKLIVDYAKTNFAHEILINEFSEGDILVSGGAKGADMFAEATIDDWNEKAYAYSKNPKKWEKIVFKPDWDRYGKKAGFLRNILIINEADKVIAFWDGTSKGTKHSIDLAIKQDKPLDIYVR